jgi:hypothetical protein
VGDAERLRGVWSGWSLWEMVLDGGMHFDRFMISVFFENDV